MKTPLEWLREYVDAGSDPAAVAKMLVGAGVGIESVEGDVLDLEITTNRADLLSMLGVARELALLGKARKAEPAATFAESGDAAGISIVVEDATFCPRYIGRVVRGVSTGPSPTWMQKRLEAAGVRAINLIADITNYVMLECGEPLHAFDLANVKNRKIVVRRARAGEKMTAIDGKEYTLTAGDGVIADSDRPVAIAGVMGGKESEIGSGTKDVLLESAIFDSVSIRRTSRRLGLKSESSYRFERGVDWSTVEWASRRATALMVELGGGKAAPGAIDIAAPAPAPRKIMLRVSRVPRLLGLKVDASRLRAIMEGLGCKIEKADAESIALTAPTGRRDIKEEVDLIEEVARIEGYDKIPTDIHMPVRVVRDAPIDLVRDEVRATLVASGAFEVLTSSFEDATVPGLVPVKNPEGFVDRTLRSSLKPALLGVLQTNEGSKEPLRPIFELSKVYERRGPTEPHTDPDLGADKAPFDERMVLGIAVPTGMADARALAQRVMDRLQIAGPIDALGNVKSEPLAAVVELDFSEIVKRAKLVRRAIRHSIQPAVTRDISMVFAEKVTWSEIAATVQSQGTALLTGVELFDVFRDKKLGPDRKSMAFSMRFLAPERTLTGSEVDGIVSAVRKALKERLGGEER